MDLYLGRKYRSKHDGSLWELRSADIDKDRLIIKSGDGATMQLTVRFFNDTFENNTELCDCGGSPHGKYCHAVQNGHETYEWQCPECGAHAGNCPHPQPDA